MGADWSVLACPNCELRLSMSEDIGFYFHWVNDKRGRFYLIEIVLFVLNDTRFRHRLFGLVFKSNRK